MVRFTPKGLSVIVRQRAISAASASGVGCVSAVRMPRPPALETAAASSARPTHCMPPWTMGCSMPSRRENGVLIAMSERLHDGHVGQSAAFAHRLQAIALAACAQCVHQGGHELGAGGPERMAECDRAAVDVEAVRIGLQRLLPGQCNRSEGLVDLVE